MNIIGGMVGRIGRSEPAEHILDDREAPALREQRVYQARNKTNWAELEESVLVERGPWLVDADTDLCYAPHRGATFVGGTVEFDAQRTDVAFFVDQAGDVVVLEALPATWSEVVERQTRSEHRAKAGSR